MGSKRRRFTGQQKLQIVLEGLQVDNVAEFCRSKDIAEVQFYNWKKKFGGLGPSELRRLRQLRKSTSTSKSSSLTFP
jgi:putative transposase